MCLIFTVLFALIIGILAKAKLPAVALFLALFGIIFSFQTLNLLMEWLAGSDEAFGNAPTTFPAEYGKSDVLAYGIVNAVFALVGVGLVLLGTRIAGKRAAKKDRVSVA